MGDNSKSDIITLAARAAEASENKRQAIKEALDDAFRDWRAENNHALELGGTGDVLGLLARLSAAVEKAWISS